MVFFMIWHVTLLLIVAFFILFAATKAEGLVGVLGRVLAAWVFLLAVLHVVAFFMPNLVGMKNVAPGMMHRPWAQWGAPPPAGPPDQPPAPGSQ